MTVPELTFSEWLASPGFGGITAVVAAVLAFIAARRATRVQILNARKDQWWDRLKWAVELALSSDDAKSAAGLRALEAIINATGFDDDEWKFLVNIADFFLVSEPSGTLGSEEATDE